MHLEQLGWDPAWSHLFAESLPKTSLNLVPARIIRPLRGACEVVTETATVLATYAGNSEPAALGDWVAFDPVGLRIHCVLPARNRLQRQTPEDRGYGVQTLAANFHTVAVVMGLDEDFNLSRLERYLVLTAAAKATPLILLNKRDICPDPWWRLAQVERIAPYARIELISALEDDLPALINALLPPAETMIFTGSSGAGKSTITNALLGAPTQATRSVREYDGRGRHCTVDRRLFLTPHGRVVADIPGLRLVGLVDSTALNEALPVYDPHDPRQAANRKRMEKEGARAIRAHKRLSTKW